MSLSSRLYGTTSFTPKKTEQELLAESVQSVVKKRKVEPVTVKPLIPEVKKQEQTKPIIKAKKTTPAYGTKGFLATSTGEKIKAEPNPLALNIADVASLKLASRLPGYKEAQEEGAKKFPVASTLGTVAGYLAPGTIGAKLVKPLVAKVGSALGKRAFEGAVVGSGITAAENIVPLIKKEKDIKQVGKEIATGLVTGGAVDVGLFRLGKLAKPLLDKIKKGVALSQAEKVIVAKQTNVSVDNVDKIVDNYRKTIQEELGLPKETTAGQFKAQAEADAYYESFKKTPQQIVDDFQNWRSKNFSGATGKMAPQDIKALKELYLENTGIDFDGEIAQAKQDFTNRLGQGQAVITPPKPKVEDIPVVSDTAPLQPLKPVSTKPPKQESSLAKALRIQEELKSGVKATLEATDIPTERVLTEVDTLVDSKEKVPTIKPIEPQVQTPEVGESTAKFYKSTLKSEQIPETVKQRLAPLEERFKLPTTSDEARGKMADDFIKQSKDDAVRLVKSGDKFESSVEPFIADRLIKSLTDEGKHDDVIEIIESISRKSRAAGQDVQAMSIWSKATPEGMQKWVLKTLEEGNVKPDIARETAKQVGEDMRRLQKETSPEELSKLVASKIKNKSERNAFMSLMSSKDNIANIRALGVSKIQTDALNKIAVGAGRKLSTAQAMAHLLNARTFARNILGNVGSLSMEGISNIPANAFDSVISLATGKKTVSSGMPKWQQGAAQGIKQGKQSMAEILLGVNKVQKDKYDMLMGTSFDKVPVLRGAEKALSLSLNVPDEFFKGFAKANSLYDQVRARIGKKANSMTFDEILNTATPDEFQTAIDEAAYATFQNDSMPAKFLTKAKQTLNLIGIGKDSKTGIKEFGLGDLVIKYTKVPGNIVSRGVEYSPAGAAKGLYYLTQIPNDPQKQRQAAQALGRAFTGTSAMGLGYTLHKLGIMSADKETADPKEMALKRSEGVSGNKINTSALKRYITGKPPEPQEGDVYKDLAWLQPVSAALSVGANVSANDGKSIDVLNTSGKTLEEVLDLPTLYTIKSMLYESQKEGATTTDVLTVPVAEAIPGFIPSPARQLAQTIDPVIRETKGKDLAETTKLKILANIPGQSQKLEPRVSPTGEELKRAGGLLTSLVTPSATTEYKPSGYTDKLQELKKLTDKSTQFPTSKAPNKIIYKNKDIILTPKQKTEYMKLVGSYVDEKYSKLLSGKNIKSLSPKEAESLVDRLESIKKDAAELAKKRIFRGQQQ